MNKNYLKEKIWNSLSEKQKLKQEKKAIKSLLELDNRIKKKLESNGIKN